MYIGMDVDKDKCHVALIDENGEEIKKYQMENNPTELDRFIQKTPSEVEIALESSTCSKPIYWQLKKNGLKVHMAAPGKIALISQSKKKTDGLSGADIHNIVIEMLPHVLHKKKLKIINNKIVLKAIQQFIDENKIEPKTTIYHQ